MIALYGLDELDLAPVRNVARRGCVVCECDREDPGFCDCVGLCPCHADTIAAMGYVPSRPLYCCTSPDCPGLPYPASEHACAALGEMAVTTGSAERCMGTVGPVGSLQQCEADATHEATDASVGGRVTGCPDHVADNPSLLWTRLSGEEVEHGE